MISFVWEKFVQSMVRIVQYFCEEVVVHVSNQLRWRGVADCVKAEPDSMSHINIERCYLLGILIISYVDLLLVVIRFL